MLVETAESAERDALREFLDVVEAARVRNPDLHVFHYGHHEKGKLRSLAQKYGASTPAALVEIGNGRRLSN